MRFIKQFENYNKETEERLNDILDKMNKGDELSQHDKDTLSSISNTDKAKNTYEEVLKWLDDNLGHLEKDVDTYKSFGKTINKMVLFDNKTYEPYITIDLKSDNRGEIAHVDYDIIEKLYSYYKLDKDDINQIVCKWLLDNYDINVQKVLPFFGNKID